MPSILYYPPNPNSDPFWADTILFMPMTAALQYTCLKGRTTNPRTFFNSATIDGFECTDTNGHVSYDSLFNFTDSDLTIECYVRLNNLSLQQSIFTLYNTDSPYQNPWLRFFFFTNNKLLLDLIDSTNGYESVNSGSFSFSTGTWYHVAATREGDTWKIWVDGTEQGSKTDSRTLPTQSDLLINVMDGANPAQSRPTFALDGYIHDLRITKACRYTGTFTPPTVPFPTS